MDYLESQKRKINPKENANIFSNLTFFYTLGLFRKGWKKDLEEKDMYEVMNNFRSKKLGDHLEEEWEKQKTRTGNRSIFRLLWSCYGRTYLMLGFIQLIIKTTIILLQPQALGKLVSYFTPGQTNVSKQDALIYAGLVVGLNLISCVYIHNYHIAIAGLGIKIRTAFCSFIYRKILKLSPALIEDISIGKIVTLITKDVNSFEIFVIFANDLWIGLVKTAVICYLIYAKIGVAAFAGVGFFFVIFPVQFLLGKLSTNLRMKMCKKTDDRLQATQETLSAIRIIKMYTWEKIFSDRIAETRKKEVYTMHKVFYVKFITLVIGTLNSKIAFYLLIMTYIWMGKPVTAEIVYFIISCFNILVYTLGIMFPMAITQTAELYASVKRIGSVVKVLELETFETDYSNCIKSKIILKDVSMKLKNKQILHDVNLHVDMGLTLITGPVGSGKSILLKTILQDYLLEKGSLVVQGKISYASQEPWLFPSSIKQNIIFEEKFDDARYQEVLRVCALKYDLEILPHGDSTIVEDRGINLSKGQQARINLARAIYKDSDIYLLDDCLSALDASVSKYIFQQCIKEYLRDKLVILVTHNLSYLNDVDNVVLFYNGTVKSVVKPNEIEEKDIINDGSEKKPVDTIDDDRNELNELSMEEARLMPVTPSDKKVYQESQQSGSVNYAVYKKYIGFGGGIISIFFVGIIFAGSQFASSYSDKIVSNWVNIEQNISNYSLHNLTDTPEYERTIEHRDNVLRLYSVMIALTSALTLGRAFAFLTFARRASINLHKYMIANVINATMHFFDNNFIGNILNRFSKDLTTIDELLPFVFYHVGRILLLLIGIITLIAMVNWSFLLPAFLFFGILSVIRYLYLPTGRSLKRLEAITRSPVIGHLNATLEGLTTVRAFKAEKILKNEFDRHQDLYTSVNYTLQCSMRAFAFFLDTLCTFFIASIVARFIFGVYDTDAGNVGLALTQAFMLTGTLQWGIRQWAEIENQMTSVERVLEYTEVKQENKSGRHLENWPNKGDIVFSNVYLSYSGTKEYVLRNLNFHVKPLEKLGIVGRTGAGKSSIISSLFRLYEIEGKVLIDGEDIKTLAIEFLRNKISIIPQDPVLFTGTIRSNIDPRGHYSDSEIWDAIEAAKLKSIIDSLDFPITENGTNFSVGQRQLICLARAVVRQNKIIVLDEATANMDAETDALINEAIKINFSSCTIILIAHKLHSVLKCDKVMVLNKGEIVQFDTPKELLRDKDGIFYEMVDKAGLLPTED